MTNRIREIRLKRRMTQTELGNLLGVSQPYIHDLECGHRGAKRDTLIKVAKALNVTIEQLFDQE